MYFKSKPPHSGVLCAALSALFLLLLAAATMLLCYFSGMHPPSDITSAEVACYPLIIIDAGHGGEDGGAVGADGTYEKDLNLDISLTLRDMLAANDIPVLMTRTEDILLYDRNVDYKGRKKILDLRARMKVSEDNPGAIFVSIHMNAFPQKQYSGLQVYYSPNTPESEMLAKTIQERIREILQPDNLRKAKAASSGIYLLHDNPNTSVLVECGFLSNDYECSKLKQAEYRRQLSLILFSAITERLDGAEINNNKE